MRVFSSFTFAAVLLPAVLCAQPGIPRDVEFALLRIERAFQTASPQSIEDLLSSGMMIRLGDSLHRSISSVTALEVLKKFFSDKKNVMFRFASPGTGRFIYSAAGKRDTVSVDVWFSRVRGELTMYALNISNYPSATVFLDLPASRR